MPDCPPDPPPQPGQGPKPGFAPGVSGVQSIQPDGETVCFDTVQPSTGGFVLLLIIEHDPTTGAYVSHEWRDPNNPGLAAIPQASVVGNVVPCGPGGAAPLTAAVETGCAVGAVTPGVWPAAGAISSQIVAVRDGVVHVRYSGVDPANMTLLNDWFNFLSQQDEGWVEETTGNPGVFLNAKGIQYEALGDDTVDLFVDTNQPLPAWAAACDPGVAAGGATFVNQVSTQIGEPAAPTAAATPEFTAINPTTDDVPLQAVSLPVDEFMQVRIMNAEEISPDRPVTGECLNNCLYEELSRTVEPVATQGVFQVLNYGGGNDRRFQIVFDLTNFPAIQAAVQAWLDMGVQAHDIFTWDTTWDDNTVTGTASVTGGSTWVLPAEFYNSPPTLVGPALRFDMDLTENDLACRSIEIPGLGNFDLSESVGNWLGALSVEDRDNPGFLTGDPINQSHDSDSLILRGSEPLEVQIVQHCGPIVANVPQLRVENCTVGVSCQLTQISGPTTFQANGEAIVVTPGAISGQQQVQVFSSSQPWLDELAACLGGGNYASILFDGTTIGAGRVVFAGGPGVSNVQNPGGVVTFDYIAAISQQDADNRCDNNSPLVQQLSIGATTLNDVEAVGAETFLPGTNVELTCFQRADNVIREEAIRVIDCTDQPQRLRQRRIQLTGAGQTWVRPLSGVSAVSVKCRNAGAPGSVLIQDASFGTSNMITGEVENYSTTDEVELVENFIVTTSDPNDDVVVSWMELV